MNHLLQQTLQIQPSLSPPSSSFISDQIGPSGDDHHRPCHGFWYSFLLILPSLLFVAYLAFHANKNFQKLSNRRSHLIIAYYVLLWIASLLNLAWSSLQGWQCTPGKEVSWNFLSLFTTSGMLFLEISLVAFLVIQENYASGLETLTRIFVISGLIGGVDLLLKIIYVFGFGVPLFFDSDSPWVKWGLWIFHKLLLTGVYGFILYVHHSNWREKLPPRPAFYNYIVFMFAFNILALFACGLAGTGAAFGLWLYNFTVICYHSFYLPFLYVTFLADFFQEEDFLLDNVYYSEMKDAGFFDTDWE
ncbi:Transmembrane protein TPRA1/CAND2/CAND8 [Dillenia turbinata]|uniref:Transmembrane protein TPRA1/CAND2/CAND8 n=1 Tax=Dillenia turbinata TaxID=194707 RepID=A0AAN8Z2S1_9MAGN